jgi:hypothetical protein
MRIAIMICCCIGLAACTVVPKFKPDTNVTTPAVGHPSPPSSVAAATSGEAFTPYQNLGESSDDGLAPDESFSALSNACLRDAGYPNAAGTPFSDFGLLQLSLPWGSWGYLGVAEAEQNGFSAHIAAYSGFAGSNAGGTPSAAEQKAASKCATIVGNFSGAQSSGALAGIATLTNDIAADVRQDPSVKAATGSWSACMKQNGYQSTDPQTVFIKALQSGGLGGLVVRVGSGGISSVAPVQGGGSGQSKADKEAQIALAVTDASCTQSSDLAGIYFAVQASYSQQLADLNQQALNAAVIDYRSAYQKELAKLPQLLK